MVFTKARSMDEIYKVCYWGTLIISLLWLSSLLVKHYPIFKYNNDNVNQSSDIWERFERDKLIYYINNKNKVFIDITAEWCLNCKVNKKLVLENKEIIDLFKKNNIKLMRADWTFPDNNIFEFLKEYNRYGIPFNIYFSENTEKVIYLAKY